jgi:secondary thiamine-phosphate synthase enzyme
MKQAVTEFQVATRGKGLYEFTAEVERWVDSQRFATGLLTLFCQHTSASLVIQENADRDVQTDLRGWFDRTVREDDPNWVHTYEGPDDMPAHVKSALTGVQLSVPLIGGRLSLGTWQGIYLFEHRRSAHRRTVAAHLMGEP